MSDHVRADDRCLKKLVLEAEALADESALALAELKRAMLAARPKPKTSSKNV